MDNATSPPRRPVVLTLTYNERENIRPLVAGLLAQNVEGLSVLIVDDGSPDGTGEEADALARASGGQVHVLHRARKEGYGAAYLAGLQHILEHDLGDVIVSMDADLSHGPQYVPALLAAVKDTHDVAVASRYVPGGGIEDWPPERRLVSRIANGVGRYGAGLREIHDITGGFRAYTAAFARSLASANLRMRGYGFLTSLHVEMKNSGARFHEVPYTYVERRVGESKLRTRDILGFLGNVARLGFKQARRAHLGRRMARFGLVGLAGMAVNMALLFALTDLAGWYYLASALFAIEASVLVNFSLHERVTFPDRAPTGFALKRLTRYHGAVAAGILVNIGALFVLTHFAGLPYMISNGVGIVLGFGLNFIVSSTYAWVLPHTGAGP